MATPSNNPFQQRLLEKQTSQEPREKSFQPSGNPFEKRAQERDKTSDSIWKQTFDMITSSEPTAFEEGLGQSLRAIGSTVLGLPGDLYKLVEGISEKLPKGPEIFRQKPTFVQEVGKKALSKIPGSEEIRQAYDVLTEGKYKPGNKTEEVLQNIASDTAALALPAKRFGQLGKALAASVTGNLVKEGSKDLIGDSPAEAAKIGSMLAVSMFNPKGAMNYARGLYDEARQLLPEGATVGAEKISSNLNALEKDLSKGLKNIPTKAPVLSAIEEIKGNVAEGKIPIENLLELKRNLNEQRAIKIYDPELRGKEAKAALRRNYNRLASVLDEAVKEYGTANPEFLDVYKKANQAFGGIQQSRKISDYISRHAKKTLPGSALIGALEYTVAPGIAAPTAIGTAAGFSALKAGELLHRIAFNPTLRQYYVNVLTNASKENAPAMIKNLKDLDKHLKNTSLPEKEEMSR